MPYLVCFYNLYFCIHPNAYAPSLPNAQNTKHLRTKTNSIYVRIRNPSYTPFNKALWHLRLILPPNVEIVHFSQIKSSLFLQIYMV
jgi:hypothetical protein